MFKKVLIANRGEIASRVIRTCKKMEILTVAIYSEADEDAPHVKQADEAFLVGGPRVNESYLNMERIIEVAKETGAEAIHPGYGLLSENTSFASRCQDEGITFIGPSNEVIAKMGSKIEALKKVFAGNQKRATDFFGNGEMFVEKFVENPRHIEIQVLADQEGNTVYLWERECSIQRRHQKVLEEAPSPFLDEQTRKQMGEAAVTAAKSIGYSNAGTIEFLVDEEKKFYFLEMNTRLQVEHPVTEEITGLDLVEEQLKIAFGEKLTFSQEEVKREGHAIEVRVYAEDPVRFFPSPGKITKLVVPIGPGVRNEMAVTSSSTVTPYYDPMIAKLITSGSTREEAINKIKEALDTYVIEGIKTNIPTLQKIIDHEAFLQGDTTTNFIEKYL
jgi:acetyl-CoA carboxylase biotin carboxylase subunit